VSSRTSQSTNTPEAKQRRHSSGQILPTRTLNGIESSSWNSSMKSVHGPGRNPTNKNFERDRKFLVVRVASHFVYEYHGEMLPGETFVRVFPPLYLPSSVLRVCLSLLPIL
jgi:hypothetical protein